MATVLAVDDEADILELIRVVLGLDGHTVLTALSAEKALEVAKNNPPDLILLDVMMPEMDGFTLLAKLKAEAALDLTQTPVLMVTARSAQEDRIRGGIEGALRYITKPFVPAELREEVRDALAGDPEPVKRRMVQRASLEQLARLETGDTGPSTAARPHLTRMERTPEPKREAPQLRVMRQRASELSEKQRELLAKLASSPSVSQAADDLEVSRSNIYASLRRIGRKLGTHSVQELLRLIREGDLFRTAE